MPALDWSQCPAVESIPGKVSGAWVLRGTRMPVSNLRPEVLTRLLRLLLAADVRSL